MLFFAGVLVGFLAGTAATIVTLFIAGHLRERTSEPPRWVDAGRWEETSSHPALRDGGGRA